MGSLLSLHIWTFLPDMKYKYSNNLTRLYSTSIRDRAWTARATLGWSTGKLWIWFFSPPPSAWINCCAWFMRTHMYYLHWYQSTHSVRLIQLIGRRPLRNILGDSIMSQAVANSWNNCWVVGFQIISDTTERFLFCTLLAPVLVFCSHTRCNVEVMSCLK